MVEIGADDLRFTVEETAALLKETQGPALSEEDISALNARTEGWAVGLRMAGLSMRGQDDVREFLANFTGSQRYIMDYLVEEVLKLQPPVVRDFLLKTSVLERLTGPLCDHVTGHSGGGGTLVKLESAFGGFLVPLDGSRQWYRYHHLLAELLRHQLVLASEAEEVSRLHQRASQWHDDNHFPDDAVHHALAARDWEAAMRFIYQLSEERIGRGEYATLINWLRSIPDEVLRTDVHLYLQYSYALGTAGQLDATEAALSYLEHACPDNPSLQGEVAASQAELSRRRGDVPRALKSAEKALALLAPDNLAMRAKTSFILGHLLIDTGRLREAGSLMTEAHQMARQSANYFVAAGALALSAQILWLRGRLREALGTGQQAAELAGPSPAAAHPR